MMIPKSIIHFELEGLNKFTIQSKKMFETNWKVDFEEKIFIEI